MAAPSLSPATLLTCETVPRLVLRSQGLRPVQIWVPDVRSPEFIAEAHRQSARVAAADRSSDDLDFIEAISVDWDE